MDRSEWMPVNPCEECNRDPEMSCKSTKFKFICSPNEVYKKQMDAQKKLLDYQMELLCGFTHNGIFVDDILSMQKQLEEKNG